MSKYFKKLVIFAFSVLLINSVSYSQDDMKHQEAGEVKGDSKTDVKSDEPVGIKMEDGILYGKDYDPGMTMISFSDLMSSSADLNGKMVLVKGDVSEVCQKMGCWMTMSDGTNSVRVKTLHEFFLPKDVAGRNAVVIGTFNITEISEEDAKHYNEESKNPAQKTEDIKGSQKAYEIDALGIKILNAASESSK